MLPTSYIRPLTMALASLIGLVTLCIILLLSSAFLYPAESSPAAVTQQAGGPASAVKPVALTEQQTKGKELFTNNCAQCHAVTEEVVVGPGLKGVKARTPGEAWLINWIRNSQAVVASGDPYAVQVYNKYNKIPMSNFPNLTDENIKAILAYVDPAGAAN
ncbi:cytochrome c class I [Fibrisoma limi BUZ 3]|uniref:Cytochrome c class I n=1 Tax=Fibrisoma limi BUZ 3 TaxID=1185876 RepID=I2GH38_9BACT|nr:cytochrome c [Fibrisoma limi]CCH53213.1 cytochrome c class I [Fibrisoma limi BUZ 3]